MRGTALRFALLQGGIVLCSALVAALLFGSQIGLSLVVGGACGWLGSLAYAALQGRGVPERATAALKDHLLGQLTKWLVACGALYVAIRSGTGHSPAALTLGFIVAMLAHGLALPWLKSR